MCKRTAALFAALLATSFVKGADSPQSAMTSAPLIALPTQWNMMGNGGPQALPGLCEIGTDSQKTIDGLASYSVRCSSTTLPSFAGARKGFDVAPYRGKRLRVSATVMSAGIEKVANPQYPNADGEAGLWIGLGTPREGLLSNRMQGRTIKGTTSWTTHDFVVDVPADAIQLQAGFWMQGKGQFWVRDLKFEEVPQTVAVNWDRNAPSSDAAPDLTLAAASVPGSTDAFLPPPQKWLAQGDPSSGICNAGVDAGLLKAGQRNLSITCKAPLRVFLRQAFPGPTWWGKRVRFSAWLKTEAVVPREFEVPVGRAMSGARGAALYLAATDTEGPVYNAVVTGTTDWTYYELVIDIPRGPAYIPMGLSLNGTGQVWARDFKLEEVSRDVQVTPKPAPVR